MTAWENLSLAELSERLGNGETSACELTQTALRRIREIDGEVGAFVTVDERGALLAAEESDRRRANHALRSAYDGIPYAAKDNVCTKGLRTTCSSRVLEHYLPQENAEVIERLDAAGFVLIGKTNMDEFAMGSSTTTSAFGPSRNPRDLSCSCGGSSGGSAAAVAAGIVPFALGSDTGGSVRQPAAFCGVVGTKPTYGRISRRGMIDFAPSLDTVGIVTANVADAAMLTELLSGETTSWRVPAPLPTDVCGLRVGVICDAGNHVAVERALARSARELERGGARVQTVAFPFRDTAAITYRVLAYAEGVDALSCYETTEEADFGYEVKRRLLFGAAMRTEENRGKYLAAAQAERREICKTFAGLFERFDVLLRATAPSGAFALDARLSVAEGCDMDYATVCESLAGVPAMSVPFGADAAGLPIGVQIAAPKRCEDRLFSVGAYLERIEKGVRAHVVL